MVTLVPIDPDFGSEESVDKMVLSPAFAANEEIPRTNEVMNSFWNFIRFAGDFPANALIFDAFVGERSKMQVERLQSRDHKRLARITPKGKRAKI